MLFVGFCFNVVEFICAPPTSHSAMFIPNQGFVFIDGVEVKGIERSNTVVLPGATQLMV
jgi:hypothetical protein